MLARDYKICFLTLEECSQSVAINRDFDREHMGAWPEETLKVPRKALQLLLYIVVIKLIGIGGYCI